MSTEKVLTKIILMIIAYVEYTTLVHASVNESTTPLNSKATESRDKARCGLSNDCVTRLTDQPTDTASYRRTLAHI